MPKLPDDQHTLARRVLAHGIWTRGILLRVATAAEPGEVCPWCGDQDKTLQHLWWACPHVDEIRRAAWPAG
eukprot:5070326-Alexandrium_andersonii.AAC.1